MSNNSNLHAAKAVKDDEFYTSYEDVEKELLNYKEYLAGKTIYCNCDRPESNFVVFLNDVKDEWGIKEIYHTSIQEGVDFRSDESVEILKKSDVVISNPPFSLWREYIPQLMEYDKKFLLIGNKNCITYKEFFPLIKDNKVWVGYNNVHNFTRPDGSIKKFGNVGWFTNLPVDKKVKLELTAMYYEDDGVTPRPESATKYPKYDNYDAINVDRLADIPCDYYPEVKIVTEEELEQLKSSGVYFEILEEIPE